MRLAAAITHEPPWYVAPVSRSRLRVRASPSNRALENLKEALELYFEDAPLPNACEPPIIASIEIAA